MEIIRPEELYLESYKLALIQSISSGTTTNLDRAQRVAGIDIRELEACRRKCLVGASC